VKSVKDQWRLIIKPLKKNKDEYIPCNIDEIADAVEVILVQKVSKHYE